MTKRKMFTTLVVLTSAVALCAQNAMTAAPVAVVDTAGLQQKMLVGYQGWFSTPTDGSSVKTWNHWFRGTNLSPVVDMWPDVREYDTDELFATPLTLPDGSPAKVFSSFKEKTVVRHFRWMQEAGIDGALLQRFVRAIQDPRFFEARNQVTRNVIKGAETHGRVFAIEYDFSVADAELLKKDWIFLVDTLRVTASPRYLRHRERPLLAIWGFGFKDRNGTAAQAQALIDWFRKDAPEKYRATIMGGVPEGWRTGTGSSHPEPAWAKVYRSLDVISPWAVGRFADNAGADRFNQNFIVPDLLETKRLGIDYLPVVFPGFSWKNLKNGRVNQIPRNGGRFYWNQIHNAITSGATMLKTAMFDEVDEGTAIFKVSESKASAPVEFPMVNLNADGETLPSDWYLRVAAAAAQVLKKEIKPTKDLPLRP
jgi:hypothetical protein